MRGSLSEFTLSELLQLFALSEKTGTVTVSHDAGDTRLFLEAGRVVGWGPDDFDAHASILACRFLPPTTEAAVRSITPDPGTPGLAFVVKNLVEPQRWASFVQRLLEQDVYGILDIEDGEFDIIVERIPPIPLGLNLSVQQLILDGSRWDADTSELAHEGYAVESSWQRAGAESFDARAEVTPREWLILAALAECHTIGEVGRMVCMPDLDTAEIVKGLHMRHLVMPSATV